MNEGRWSWESAGPRFVRVFTSSLAGALACAFVSGCGGGAPAARAGGADGSDGESPFATLASFESAVRPVLRACADDGSGDGEACAKAWGDVPALGAEGLRSCQLVVGASTDWYAGAGSRREDAERQFASFAGGDKVLVRYLRGDSVSGEGAIVVVRAHSVGDDVAEPIDDQTKAVRERLTNACDGKHERPRDLRRCASSLRELSEDPAAFVKGIQQAKSTGTVRGPTGTVLVSPGCQKQVEAKLALARKRQAALVKSWAARRAEVFKEAEGLARLGACAEPASLQNCDPADEYLRLLQQEGGSAEAIASVNATLAVARPKLDVLDDHRIWADADSSACAAPKSEDACTRVEGYLEVRPTGLHATEAKNLLKSAKPKLAQLEAKRKAEEAKAAALAKIEEAKAAALAKAEAAKAAKAAKSKPYTPPSLECRSANGYTICCPNDYAFGCLADRVNEEYMNGIEDHSMAFIKCGCKQK